MEKNIFTEVLILVLVEDSLWVSRQYSQLVNRLRVLILVLVEDSLWEQLEMMHQFMNADVLILVLVEDSLWVQAFCSGQCVAVLS